MLEETDGWAFGVRIRGMLPSRFADYLIAGPVDESDIGSEMTVAYRIVGGLAEGVPVRHVSFPGGIGSSRRIREAIAKDLAGTRPAE